MFRQIEERNKVRDPKALRGRGEELQSNFDNCFWGVEGFGTQLPPKSRGDFTQAKEDIFFSESSKKKLYRLNGINGSDWV